MVTSADQTSEETVACRAQSSALQQAIVLLVALLALCLTATSAWANGPDASGISLSTRLVPLDGNLVRVELTNDGLQAVNVQTRDTPFDTIHAHSLLIVERSLRAWSPLSRLPYIGRLAKREAPQAHEVLLLEPGETASAVVDVGANYQVDVAEPYRITLAHGWTAKAVDDYTSLSRQFGSTARTVMMLSPRLSETVARARTPSFDGCSTAQQSDIIAAADVAEDITNEAIDALVSIAGVERSTSPRYRTWFGTYEMSRYARVQDNLSSISDALAERTVNYVCGCSDVGVYAYVYPNRPYDVYLCPAFWRADIDGTDSRAGTIVHELSHFSAVAGTGDHRYSQSGAQQLAIESPALAIDNADSHEYFAENTPLIAMAGSGDLLEDSMPDDVQSLFAGEYVEGFVAAGATQTFRTSGVTRVRLDSISGDSDLTVWGNASRSMELCRSIASPPLSDHCDLSGEDVWIEVYGYSSAEFKLVVIGEGESLGTSIPLVDSAIDGDVLQGVVEQGELLAYAVNEGSVIVLDSLEGDADLYVFEGFEATRDRVVCVSSSVSSVGAVRDSCTADADGAHLAVVFGYRAASFELSVSGGDMTAPDIPGDPIEASDSDVARDDDSVAQFSGGAGGCSVGATAHAGAAGAGGALPMMWLLLMMLWMRRVSLSAPVPLSLLCGMMVMSSACSNSGQGGHSGAADPTPRVHVGLETAPRGADAGVITAWVENTSSSAVELLIWNTPFEQPLSADIFTVTRNGEPLPYQGRMVKRASPQPGDWLALSPGERLTVDVDLALAYGIEGAGDYRVALAPVSIGSSLRFNEGFRAHLVGGDMRFSVVD